MLKTRHIFFLLIGLYILTFLTLNLISYTSQPRKLKVKDIEIPSQVEYGMPEEYQYKFHNPKLAHKVLSLIDKFQPVDNSYYVGRFDGKSRYSLPYYGLKSTDDYCKRHRAYITANPEAIFEQVNMVLTAHKTSLMRTKCIEDLAEDMHPKVGLHMKQKDADAKLYEIKANATFFHTKTPMFIHKHIGKHFSCTTQLSNHIPGHSSLDRKDNVAENAIKYGEKYTDRPQCFSHDKIFPKTWLLYNKEHCKDFFKILNSKQYKQLKKERTIVYIRKIAARSHRGEGVQPVNQKEEDALKELYGNGKLCGNVTKSYIVQNYVHNPLLLDGHKFDFRMYMLIASTNPLMAYYHDGFLRVTLAEYDVSSGEKKALLTNLALNKQIYDDVKGGNLYKGMDEESLKLAQQWNFDRLQEYLLEKGIVTDPNWLDNYLRPEFKKAMVHLLRLSSFSFLKHSSLYELYGVDFMLDENLNLWFIEANSSPAIEGYSIPMEKFIVKMVRDHFELMTGLLRSRMKRIVDYINYLDLKGIVKNKTQGRVVIQNIKEKVEHFNSISKNYFEDEFLPSSDNGFVKILDENLYGVDRYQNLLGYKCL